MGERFEEQDERVERLNAQGVDGRDCPLCYRRKTIDGERKLNGIVKCAGCYARFRFHYLGPAPLYDVLERIPTPLPPRKVFETATPEQHNAGARIADDFACKCCGARGWRNYCPTCERAA